MRTMAKKQTSLCMLSDTFSRVSMAEFRDVKTRQMIHNALKDREGMITEWKRIRELARQLALLTSWVDDEPEDGDEDDG